MTNLEAISDADLVLTLQHEFACSPERLWQAWTKPEEVACWFGPEGCTAPDAVVDFRVGGSYHFPIQNSDGSVDTVTGEYTQIDQPHHLAFTWSWVQSDGRLGQKMLINLDFEYLGGKTRLRLFQTNFINKEAQDLHKEGWSSSMNSLQKHLGL